MPDIDWMTDYRERLTKHLQQNNKDYIYDYHRRWSAENKEHIKKYKKDYYKMNKEKQQSREKKRYMEDEEYKQRKKEGATASYTKNKLIMVECECGLRVNTRGARLNRASIKTFQRNNCDCKTFKILKE